MSDAPIVPWGFRQLLNHVHKQYAGPNGLGIIITENGFAIQDEADRTLDQIVDDKERQEYYDLYITELCQAHKEGIKMEGYLGWSLLEWVSGRSPVRKVLPKRAMADLIVSTC
jgi:beta-glucosidase/6-phospho-beta-glucosidase/beta-galactosidase